MAHESAYDRAMRRLKEHADVAAAQLESSRSAVGKHLGPPSTDETPAAEQPSESEQK